MQHTQALDIICFTQKDALKDHSYHVIFGIFCYNPEMSLYYEQLAVTGVVLGNYYITHEANRNLVPTLLVNKLTLGNAMFAKTNTNAI